MTLYFRALQEMLREQEEERARKRARKLEEKKKKKRQQAVLAARLKAIAVCRREEAQRLMGVLLAGAAEARLVEEKEDRWPQPLMGTSSNIIVSLSIMLCGSDNECIPKLVPGGYSQYCW